MNEVKHISEFLPALCKEIGIPCPEAVLKRAEEEKIKREERNKTCLTGKETHTNHTHA